jgi:hypothetical protein
MRQELFHVPELKGVHVPEIIERFRKRLDQASSHAEVWEIVKKSVEVVLRKRRSGMMLFLEDLPIQVGAYHPLGTNNIVLNRVLVQTAEATIKEKRVVNALVYILLLHEYLHSLGEYSEARVKRLVVDVSKKCFGEDYPVTYVAIKSPWSLFRGIPLSEMNASKRVIEIVKDFEKTRDYVV